MALETFKIDMKPFNNSDFAIRHMKVNSFEKWREIIIIIITCSSQCMKREMSQCCGIKQSTQTEITANRPDIIIKKPK
jgi:hypothetical protein